MNWQIIDVLMSHLDDIRDASALARLNRDAPSIHTGMKKKELERRDTVRRKSLLLTELRALEEEVDFADFFLTERDGQIDDRRSIIRWCRVENEGEILYTEIMDEDGVPDVIDLTEFIPVLRRTGFWQWDE